ncbi:MAG: hypothetical protein DLM53_11550 [Candidatus Eremiobacter antarcticus]|nr:MAG: hypothetical protein DLM53_11550 [Candidatus Eremiobacter sp. RRmetagenome_bin22]
MKAALVLFDDLYGHATQIARRINQPPFGLSNEAGACAQPKLFATVAPIRSRHRMWLPSVAVTAIAVVASLAGGRAFRTFPSVRCPQPGRFAEGGEFEPLPLAPQELGSSKPE